MYQMGVDETEGGHMTGHICYSITDKCWNLIDSYGMICVHCGCCAKDKATRYKARIKVLESWLKDQYAFDNWDDEFGLRETQEKNIKANIRSFKRMLRYYRERLENVESKEAT